MAESILKSKSYDFGLKIVKTIYKLQSERKEFILTKQLLRSGTAIGALIEEAGNGESTRDFIHKLAISNKEANESRYWLSLLRDSELLEEDVANNLILDVEEIIKMLVASIKTSRIKLEKT
ncbi:MAG: four helix bundle protein [Cyclobacteriaceae bacterium]